jgi:hypothetical protein
LLFGFSGFSQSDSLECQGGIQKAIEDSKEGVYNSHKTEPLNRDSFAPTIDEFYLGNEVEVTKNNYNINFISTPKSKIFHNL